MITPEKRITLRISDALHASFVEIARRERISLQRLCVGAMIEGVSKLLDKRVAEEQSAKAKLLEAVGQ